MRTEQPSTDSRSKQQVTLQDSSQHPPVISNCSGISLGCEGEASGPSSPSWPHPALAGFLLLSRFFKAGWNNALPSPRPLPGAGCCLASSRWSPDVPGHTHQQQPRGSHGLAAAVPGALLAVGCFSGLSGVREHGWPRAVEKEPAKTSLCQREPNCRLLCTAPAAARNTGQLLCHNLIAFSSQEM